jgi:predicted amidohydrolase
MAQFDFPSVRSNPTPAHRAMIAEAREYGADVVLFPGWRSAAIARGPAAPCRYGRLRGCAAARRRGHHRHRRRVAGRRALAAYYNAASVLRDGGIAQTYRKRRL